MNPRLSVEAISHDLPEIKIVFTASNDRFAGSAGFWMDYGCAELRHLVGKLRGFPKSIDDVEEWQYGFTAEYRASFKELKRQLPQTRPLLAYVRLRFVCIDHLGHTAVDVAIHEDAMRERADANGEAHFEIQFEPAQIDSFCEELIALVRNKMGTAVLQGIATP